MARRTSFAALYGASWMDDLITYLKNDVLQSDKREARRVILKSSKFVLGKDNSLYRRSWNGPMLKVVHPSETQLVLQDLHKGSCGSHAGGRTLAHRAITQGYWWPRMEAEGVEYVKRCDRCQRFASIIRQPAEELNPLESPWPFA